MADIYKWSDRERQPLREQRLLGFESARDVYVALGFSRFRQTDGKSVDGISEMGEAPDAGRLLRCHGAFTGTLQEDRCSDSNHHGSLRRRSARRVHLLQAAHEIRNRGGQGESLFDCRALGSRGNAHPAGGSRRTEIRRSQRSRFKQVAHGMVRLGNEGWDEAGILEETRGLLRSWSGRMEIR